MNNRQIGGIALIGAGILGGYYLLKQSQTTNTPDLSPSGLGTGGNTALTPIIPGTENVTSPYVESPDSVGIGIEDDGDSPENRGMTEFSDSGAYDIPAEKVDSMQFLTQSAGELAPWVGLGIAQSGAKFALKKSASSAGGLFARLFGAETLGGIALKSVTRTIPVMGGIAFASDMLIARGGTNDVPIGGVENGFTLNETTGELTPTHSVSGVEQVSTNYGSSTLSKPYTGSTISALNSIAGVPAGTAWKQTYHAEKTGASQSKGSTTNTYKASSGQQVALAGITASDYAAYLESKK